MQDLKVVMWNSFKIHFQKFSTEVARIGDIQLQMELCWKTIESMCTKQPRSTYAWWIKVNPVEESICCKTFIHSSDRFSIAKNDHTKKSNKNNKNKKSRSQRMCRMKYPLEGAQITKRMPLWWMSLRVYLSQLPLNPGGCHFCSLFLAMG